MVGTGLSDAIKRERGNYSSFTCRRVSVDAANLYEFEKTQKLK